MLRAMMAFLFRTSGWKIVGKYPFELPKAIWAGIPHTTNWDFLIAVGTRAELNMKIGFLAKSQLFQWYSGWLFRAMGCYPVHRNKSNNLVDAVAEMFASHAQLHIALAPEGTRDDVYRIKTGFYHMAAKANVPLILVGLDHIHKSVILSSPIYLTKHFQRDMKVIFDFYLSIPAKRKTWLERYAETGAIEQV
jgi:1-acyl-sn-glycerol-3-phosphate acyltransferase